MEPLAIVLSAPSFLYMVESSGGKEALTSHELATRLSYFLWSTTPDKELAELAESEKLGDPAVLYEQTQCMIADPKFDRFIRGFVHQWLEMERVDMFQFSGAQFPEFDNAVRANSREELFALVQLLVKERLPLKDLLPSNYVVINDQRSVLDTVLSDAKSINLKLDKTDSNKLDEYFQSVREIEVRLAKEEKWLAVDKKTPSTPLIEPGDLEGVEEIRMMYDLMVAAMQVDASRVFTYRMPANRMIQSLGATMSAHTMSHFSEGERRTVSQKRDTAHAKLLAEFFDKLKASKEPDGSSLFDHCSITFGTNLSSVHALKNCPTLIAARAF